MTQETTHTNRAGTKRLIYRRGEGYFCQVFDGIQWTYTGLEIAKKKEAFEWLLRKTA